MAHPPSRPTLVARMPNTVSIEDAIEQLQKDGFYYMKDQEIGSSILAMEAAGSQFSISKEGLSFYKLNILKNDVIKKILEKSFERCRLGYYTRIKADPGHIVQLRKGGDLPDILCVLLWDKGSRAIYYPGSHLEPLESYRSANRLWEVTSASLKSAGCERKSVDFEDGGWCILDARLAFERRGRPIVCGFATEEELRKWPMLVPTASTSLAELSYLIPELKTEKIGIYLEHIEENPDG